MVRHIGDSPGMFSPQKIIVPLSPQYRVPQCPAFNKRFPFLFAKFHNSVRDSVIAAVTGPFAVYDSTMPEKQ